MPLYNTPQSGGVLSAVAPGDKYIMFDGTETPAAGLASVAFNRACGPLTAPALAVFTVTFPNAAPTATVQIQGSNDDVDGHYQTLFTTTSGQQNSFYNDYGEFAFYRAVLNAYTNGGMPIVRVQR